MKIDGTHFGSMIVDGKKYENDLVLSWDGEVSERVKSHEFSKKELLNIIQKDPEVIIVGTGQSGLCKIDPSAEVEAKLNGIELISLFTPKAAEEFNKLVKRKKVIGVFHLTC
jgi:hypothetical protein